MGTLVWPNASYGLAPMGFIVTPTLTAEAEPLPASSSENVSCSDVKLAVRAISVYTQPRSLMHTTNPDLSVGCHKHTPLLNNC